MAEMTEEEAWALEDYVTKNKITIGPDGTDWLSRQEMRLRGMSDDTVNYLMSRALSDHKSPAEIINELVRKEIASV